MKLVAIDIGTYSIKILETQIERKSIRFEDYSELVIDDLKSEFPIDLSEQELQLEIVKAYLKNYPTDSKVVFQIPSRLNTSRYMSLPVGNKKKAEMMIPFQLEEDLPQHISGVHFALDFYKKTPSSRVLVHISSLNEFEKYHEMMDQRGILPHTLTTELSILEKWGQLSKNTRHPSSVRQGPEGHSYAIVDIGHSTTKAYFYIDDELVSNHHSFVAGKTLNEVISTTYNISLQEACEYKHNHGFFLTESQYEQVTTEQSDFAKLMKLAIWPLVQDIVRWKIGHRVKFGKPLETIFLTGGSSQMRNLANFLAQSVTLPVRQMPGPGPVQALSHLINQEQASSAWTSYLMASSFSLRPTPVNMLTGAFSNNFSTTLPLHSTSFLSWRAGLVAFILFLALAVERQFVLRRKIVFEGQITKALKNPTLGIPVKEQRSFKVNPQNILNKIIKRNGAIEQEIKTIMAQSDINAMAPLVDLSKSLASNLLIDLESFSYDGAMVRGSFSAKNAEEMGLFRKKLEGLGKRAAKFNPRDNGKDQRPSLAFEYLYP